MPTRIQLRRGTAAQWTASNPILAEGEFGYETDTNKFKIGSGVSSWSSLAYATATTASISNALITTPLLIGPEERFNVVSGSATGTINIDTLTSTAWLYTNTGNTNFTINIRGNSSNSLDSIINVGDAITVGLVNATGTSASQFFATTIQVDGSSITPKWLNGSIPPSSMPYQTTSGFDSYTITLVKTASAVYTALGSWAQFR